MRLPALRTDPVATRGIGWGEVVAGYLVLLLLVPALASGVTWGLNGLPRSGGGPIDGLRGFVGLLAMSPAFAWMGVPVSLPAVWLARRFGLFGWAVAMATGVLTGAVVFCGLDVPNWLDGRGLEAGLQNTIGTAPGNAALGLSFWITVRLLRPSAFRP